MTRIQLLAGQFKFGEQDNCSMYYNDATGELTIVDATGATVAVFGDSTNDALLDLYGKGFKQAISVRLTNGDGDARAEGTIVEAGAGADDSFTICAINSTAVIGVVKEASIAPGADGQVTVDGVANILLTAAGVRGQYVETGAVAGEGTCVAGLPAAGRCVGICIQNTGGAGLARCMIAKGTTEMGAT